MTLRILLSTLWIGLAASTAVAQHCGPFGTYGEEDGAWYSLDRRYRVVRVAGPLRFQWEERNANAEYESRSTSLRQEIFERFYTVTVFPSPTGSGYLVTGLPRDGKSIRGEEKLAPEDNWLYAFYAPTGERVHSVPLQEVLTEQELETAGSCGKPDEPG